MVERLYTAEQVNALIPKLELLVERLQRRGRELRQAMERVMTDRGEEGTSISIAELLEVDPQLQCVVGEIEDSLQEIESVGGQFKGLDLGLVDFPAEIDGEVVLLCWQYGEKEVAFYHSPDVGFAGRKRMAGRRAFLQ